MGCSSSINVKSSYGRKEENSESHEKKSITKSYDKEQNLVNYEKDQTLKRYEKEQGIESCHGERTNESLMNEQNLNKHEEEQNGTDIYKKVQDTESYEKEQVTKSTENEKDTKKQQRLEDFRKLDNYEQYMEIDDHARKAPMSVQSSIQVLAEYLASKAKDDVELVRAFYVWIGENISYDAEAYFSDVISAKTGVEDVLQCKKTVCEGFANFFHALCAARNVTCKKLHGYAKGYGHNPGDIISYETGTNHAWNAVNLYGTWQLIDATWGTGHMGENKQSVKKFTNFYFLTSPDNFIYDHFPYMDGSVEGSERWQLLKKPISIEEYSKMVKLSEEARSLNIKFPNNPHEIIKVKNSSKIVLNSSENPLKQVMFNFYSQDGENQNQCVMIIKDTSSTFTIHLHPRVSGRFYLNVFGSVKAEGSCFHLVQYIVDCESTQEDFYPFPKYRQYYGLTTDFEEIGFIQGDLKPCHTSIDGEYMLEMKTSSFPDVLATLYDHNDSKEEGFHLIETTKNLLRIRTRSRLRGYYRLVLFHRIEENSPYKIFGNILIDSRKSSNILDPFPKTYSTTTQYMCQLIKPTTRIVPSNSEVHIEFTSPIFTGILVRASGQYNVTHDKDTWKIKVNTKESGGIKISGRESDSGSYWTVYEFVIS